MSLLWGRQWVNPINREARFTASSRFAHVLFSPRIAFRAAYRMTQVPSGAQYSLVPCLTTSTRAARRTLSRYSATARRAE